MDKIRELLKKIGASEELATQIMEELDRYTTSSREKLETEYQVRIQKAKKVCLEEVAKEKARIAHKVEVFLESKAASIERAAARQRAIEESAAVAALRKVKGALGVENGNSEELQALQRKLARIAEQANALKEERDHAVEKANQANKIASRVVRRARLLEAKAPETKPEAKPAKVVTEDEGVAGLAAARTATAEPKTSVVSVADVPPVVAPVAARMTATVPNSPEDIANSMDREVA
jgi:hypothetical protein